jgi:tetratricopeptide (TPR) repeat protein
VQLFDYAGGEIMKDFFNKERVLFLLALLLVGWLLFPGSERKPGSRLRLRKQAYVEQQIPGSALVDAKGRTWTGKERDLFLPPSETVSLPPLRLELPPFPESELPVAIPRFLGSPDPSHAYSWAFVPAELPKPLLTVEGNPGAQVSPAIPPKVGSESNSGQGTETQTSEDPALAWALQYDQLLRKDERKPSWGKIVGAQRWGMGTPDPQALLRLIGPFRGPVLFQEFDPVKGKSKFGAALPVSPEKIQSLTFANTLKNRIEMEKRRIPSGVVGIVDRQEFIMRLLYGYEGAPEALSEAETQARILMRDAPKDPRGYEVTARVLFESGRLEALLVFLDEELSKTPFAKAPFVFRLRGKIAETFHLPVQAEAFYRRAVLDGFTDAKNHLDLARFLLKQGRGNEALSSAEEAERREVASMAPRLVSRIRRILTRARLAVLDLKGAEKALEAAKEIPLEKGRLAHLTGVLALAKKDYEAAQTAFREASTLMPLSVDPELGFAIAGIHGNAAGVSNYVAGSMKKRVEGRDPLRRPVALALDAFSLDLSGKAVEALDLCRQALIQDPEQFWVLYLTGREARKNGSLEEAESFLDQALSGMRVRAPIMAEMAMILYRRALESPEGGFQGMQRAKRFISKACELSSQGGDPKGGDGGLKAAVQKGLRRWVYQDLLGCISYALGENEAAKRAFLLSGKWGGKMGPHAQIFLALIRYRQGYTDEALGQLRDLQQVLRDLTDPYRKYVDRALLLIQDHRSKRLFRDHFSHEGLARHWVKKARGQPKLSWTIQDGRLVVRGRSKGDQPAFQRLTLEDIQNFVEVKVKLGVPKGSGVKTLALRVTDEDPSEGGRKVGQGFEAVLGYNRGGPWARLRDGRGTKKKGLYELLSEDLPQGFGPKADGKLVEVGVAIHIPLGNTTANPEIVLSMDGKVVLQKPLSRLRAARGRPLFFDLFVQGPAGSKIEGMFDDFELIRRE